MSHFESGIAGCGGDNSETVTEEENVIVEESVESSEVEAESEAEAESIVEAEEVSGQGGLEDVFDSVETEETMEIVEEVEEDDVITELDRIMYASNGVNLRSGNIRGQQEKLQKIVLEAI